MKAAVYHGKEQLIVEEVADPVIENGEVLLEIESCCVCGTDKRTYQHGDKKIIPPRILGHEFCGRVVESRAGDSSNIKNGDRVVMYIVMPCGTCVYCLSGRENLCASRTTMSYHHDGAFATHMKVPAKAVASGNLFKIENDIPSEHMGLSESLGCVINAYDKLNIGLKDSVVILGAGPIGILHACVSRLSGAQKVYMSDISEPRLKQAEQFDIDGVVLVKEDGSHVEQLRELTNGTGPDVVICANSVASSQIDALDLAAKCGRVEFFGGLPKSNPTALLNTNFIHYKELIVSGSFSEKKSDFQAAQALIQSGRFPSDKIITHSLPLNEITKAFELMDSGEALKVNINPQQK